MAAISALEALARPKQRITIARRNLLQNASPLILVKKTLEKCAKKPVKTAELAALTRNRASGDMECQGPRGIRKRTCE